MDTKFSPTRPLYLFYLLTFLIFSSSAFAQVGINTTSPGGGSILDIESSDKGLLIPRVDIDDLDTQAPITGTISDWLMVFNTNATTGRGYLYWNGSRWVPVGNKKFWGFNGDGGTNPGTAAGEDFLGTTDDVDFIIARNSVESLTFKTNELVVNETGADYDLRIETQTDPNLMFVDASQDNVGIGVGTPTADYKFQVYSGTGNSIYGYSDNVGGVLGREDDITIGLAPSGEQTVSGAGVYANNPFAGYTSVFAQSTGAATVAASVQYSDVWMANYSYVDNSNVGYNPNSSYIELNKNENSTGGDHTALKALSGRDADGNPGYQIGAIIGTIYGRNSGTQTEDTYGMIGQGVNSSSSFAVGAQFVSSGMGGATGYTVNIADDYYNRKIVGSGSVSEVIPTKDHGRITLTAPESPEYWYQDYGNVTMTNGQAVIELDEILSDIIVVDAENPVRVNVTPYQMPYFNGVTIMSYDNKRVVLQELNGGRHSGTLQYTLVVKPKTNYGEGRFPQGPEPYFVKGEKLRIPAAQTRNQNRANGRQIFEWPADWEVYGYQSQAQKYMTGEALRQDLESPKKKK